METVGRVDRKKRRKGVLEGLFPCEQEEIHRQGGGASKPDQIISL